MPDLRGRQQITFYSWKKINGVKDLPLVLFNAYIAYNFSCTIILIIYIYLKEVLSKERYLWYTFFVKGCGNWAAKYTCSDSMHLKSTFIYLKYIWYFYFKDPLLSFSKNYIVSAVLIPLKLKTGLTPFKVFLNSHRKYLLFN